MRTTLDIDRDLLAEVKELGGFPSFNATIRAALQFVVEEERRRKGGGGDVTAFRTDLAGLRDPQS